MATFEQAKEVLKRCFGHDGFRPEQERAIKAIMGKRDVLAVMSTGAGKSLIYQVPAVALGGTTIVVSPLVSLMSDQVRKLVELGLHPAFLNNTLKSQAQETVRRRIKNGEFQILYVAPERLSNPAFLSAIENLAIPLVAVDEAHCISEWGHDFRSDYREISAFIERFDQRPTVVALTATATPRVRKDIARSLGLQNPLEIVSSFDRANLSLSVVHMPHDERGSWCVRTARSRESECGIFYCVTISETERIHDALKRAGVPAALYHGKLDSDAKKAAQEAFMSGQAPVMVATSAFGMGIDKPDCATWSAAACHFQSRATISRSAARGATESPPTRSCYGTSKTCKPPCSWRKRAARAKTTRNVPGKRGSPSTCGISAGTKTPAGAISFCATSARNPLMTEGAEDAITARCPSTASCAPKTPGR